MKSKARVFVKSSTGREVECATVVVYDIPLSCGKRYVRQTGRCVNSRLLDHKASLKEQPCSNLSLHCREYDCAPLFAGWTVQSRFKDRVACETEEAYLINKASDSCVATPSVTLLAAELDFLETRH